jgi:hypothetical protein
VINSTVQPPGSLARPHFTQSLYAYLEKLWRDLLTNGLHRERSKAWRMHHRLVYLISYSLLYKIEMFALCSLRARGRGEQDGARHLRDECVYGRLQSRRGSALSAALA